VAGIKDERSERDAERSRRPSGNRDDQRRGRARESHRAANMLSQAREARVLAIAVICIYFADDTPAVVRPRSE